MPTSGPFEQLDATEAPLASTDLMRVTFEWRQKNPEPSPEHEAELIGLQLGTPPGGESAWGTRYGPWLTATDQDGREMHEPPKDRITVAVLNVWQEKARTARHPYLRFRFADLVWDLAPIIPAKRDVSFARLAIAAALEGLASNSFKYRVEAFKAGERALELARMIRDEALVLAVERAILEYEKRQGEDLRENTWGHTVRRIAEKVSSLPKAEQDEAVANMEARVARLAGSKPHPSTVEAAVLPLADIYRQQGKTEEVARVLRLHTQLVIDAGRRMQGMAAASFLDRLHAVLEQYGLRSDAAALSGEMREQGKRSLAEMKRFGTTITIPAEEMEEVVDGILSGTSDDALKKIAFWFVPDRTKAAEQVREMAHEAPLMADAPKAIVDKHGQRIAMIGSVEDDLEGNVVQHVSQRLHSMAVYLRATLDAAKVRIGLGPELIMAQVRLSAVFEQDKLAIVEQGLRHYFSGEFVPAVHVLVPQIEAAIRRLAILRGVMPYRRKGTSLEQRSLGSLLEDPQVEAALDPQLSFYLRILLTDVRGWNLRNEVCHGLLADGHFGPVMADRVAHAVMLLMWIRKNEEAASPQQGSEDGPTT